MYIYNNFNIYFNKLISKKVVVIIIYIMIVMLVYILMNLSCFEWND